MTARCAPAAGVSIQNSLKKGNSSVCPTADQLAFDGLGVCADALAAKLSLLAADAPHLRRTLAVR